MKRGAIVLCGGRSTRMGRDKAALPFGDTGEPPAAKADLIGLFEHLEGALDRVDFFRPPEKRPSMVRNLRAILQKGEFTGPEVKALRDRVSSETLIGLAAVPWQRQDYDNAIYTVVGQDFEALAEVIPRARASAHAT